MTVEEVRFSLHIPANTYLRYYSGSARFVEVTSFDGRRIRLPANRLRPFVTAEGIRGVFAMRFNAQRKIIDLRRIC